MTKSASGSPNGAAPSPRIWNVKEYAPPTLDDREPGGYAESADAGLDRTAIVIDNGSSTTRAGWSFDNAPRMCFPPAVSRYRDRKASRTYTLVGSDAYADAATRGQIRTAFEADTGIVSNWDVMEHVLDYVFLKLGVDGAEGGVGRSIVMTEPLANLGYARRTMNEILFECYSAPSVAYGVDSLFSYSYNKGTTGLVVSSSHSSTHLIPVVDSRPMLALTTRLSWGGHQNADFLLKLLQLKYPHFPGKMTSGQAEELVKEHCYISLDYEQEVGGYLDWTGLEVRDHIIQYPFTEQVVVQKSEEELARIAEKRKESGRRLQEQAAKMRLEKLVKKEQELDYFKDVLRQGADATKKDFKRLLESNDFETEAQLEKTIKELEKSIKKARTKDVGGAEDEEEEPSFPLLDVPDEELDEAGLKQKRQQRLTKSNVEARARAKAEKQREKARLEEEKRLDEERRENDLAGWIQDRRLARDRLLQQLKDRQRMKADLGNRKSLASQLRMKSIANLASDNVGSKKRRRGGDDDNFGANDDDWGVYRTIAVGDQSDDDEDEDISSGLKSLEAELLQHDPDFTEAQTHSAEADWTKSIVHAFLRGARPFDPDSAREAHQLHLNVERVRVPEVVFEPCIAGLDQAGLVEIAADILTQRLTPANLAGPTGPTAGPAGPAADTVLKDIFLTGGNTLFQNFDERVRRELVAASPAGSPLAVRRATDPLLDPWRGAARWVNHSVHDWKKAAVTREEFLERGADHIKEHALGNSVSS